jgi:phosphatidylinositol alpha-mannosyltransferase
VQTHIRDTADVLSDMGLDVTIIAPRIGAGPAEPSPSKTRVLRLGRAHCVRLSGTRFEASIALGAERRRLQAAMREMAFDVVHYHALWTPLLALQAFACSSSPSVVTFHDTPPDGLAGGISRGALSMMSRMLLPHVDAAIAVSEAPRGHLRPGPGQNIWVTPPCTDLRRFEAPAPARAPGDPLTILFVGRLEPRKGAGLLLTAYRRLCADGLRARLVIAGAGSEESALRRYASRHGLSDVVFSGRFEDADAPSLYGSSDIVCAPSPYGESFGIVIAEAMASGKPVVAAANRGYRTLLTGPGAQMLTAPGDADGLYARLKRLALSPALRAELGAWGRSEARRYDSRAVAPQLLDIYEHAISERLRTARRGWRGAAVPGRPGFEGTLSG